MYDKKVQSCDVTCSLLLPLSQTVAPSQTPSFPLERDVLNERPLLISILFLFPPSSSPFILLLHFSSSSSSPLLLLLLLLFFYSSSFIHSFIHLFIHSFIHFVLLKPLN